MPDKTEIFNKVADTMAAMFELERERILPSSRLADDLDIDSIDAIDLIVELKNYVGRKIEPEYFKQTRTVQDIVNAISELMGDD